MKELGVYYEQYKVGVLKQDDDLIHSFQYDPVWLTNPSRFPLSLAMPLSPEPYGNKLTLSFFENLLPEGDVLDEIQLNQKVGGTFDFLAHYGEDCAGAINIKGTAAQTAKRASAKPIPLDLEKIYESISEKISVASTLAEENVYLSLAGAQDKFAAIVQDDRLFLPASGAATTHIVKVPIQHSKIKDSVFNEHFSLELAKRVALPSVNSQILPGPYPLLLVERYDRYIDEDGVVRRLHQQDFCQAQGYLSEQKYENRGGPNLKQNYDLILKNMPVRARLKAIDLYLRWVSFNLLLGNHDSHSKNLSFLLTSKGIELAPFYDLLSTTIYPHLTRRFSFKIGDRDDFSRIGKSQVLSLEKELGLKTGVFQRHLNEMNKRIMEHASELAKQMKVRFPKVTVFARIVEEINSRRRSLEHQGIIFDS